MTSALIGLIGVVVGAVLGGIVSVYAERQRQRSAADAARLIIASELNRAKERMQSAVDTDTWWEGDLPTKAWETHLSELAFRLDPVELKRLDSAYAIIDRRNIRRKRATSPLEDGTVSKEADALDKMAGEELGRLRPVGMQRVLRAARRGPSLVIGLLLIVLLLLALFVQRPYLNATTVATALETQQGSQEYIDCDPARGDWTCTEYHLSEPRSACFVSTTDGIASEFTSASFGTSIRSPRVCEETSPPTTWDVVVDPDRLVATSAERKAAAEVISEPLPTRSGWHALLDWLTGK